MLTVLFYIGLLLLFFGAVAPAIFFRGGKNQRRLSLALMAISASLLFVFASDVIYENQEVSMTVYRILPSFYFSFFIDRLSAFFILTISVVSFGVAIYSTQYIEYHKNDIRNNILVFLMGLFILSMLLVVSSANTFSFLFFWETMSLTSFLLVMFAYENEETRKAGIFYFIMTQLSGVFLFTGFFMLYLSSGSFDISAASIDPAIMAPVFLCLFLGFSIKAGVVPFHKWLPYAHPASPSNISALMSGVMIKVAVYGLMRFVIFVLEPQLWWGVLILVAGTLSAILGIIYAMKEHDIKRLLAFSSIENIGIIMIGFGLYIIFSLNNLEDLAMLSLLGALFHTLNHAIFKSLLFLTAGSVVNATGIRNIEYMGGLIHRMPKTALLFFIGAASISALPPLNGFVGELLIFQSMMQSHYLTDTLMQVLVIICLAVFALTSALAAACFVKAFGTVFLALPRSQKVEKANEVGMHMLLGPSVLAASCIFLGLSATWLFSKAGYYPQIPDMGVLGAIMAAAFLAIFGIVWVVSSHRTRDVETWRCGIRRGDGWFEYTATGFSQPIMNIFRSVYRTREDYRRTFFDRSSVIFRDGRAEIHLLNFFEVYIYLPIAGFISRVAMVMYRLHNGKLDTYLYYTFITIIILLVSMRWLA
ncbi:MAG: hydrogenase membrane subunit [Candidatus Altiarchaeales archaeon IMC4]|nr:MAG: hydrogenase membrane subunit [Candidatus Altiarchaeales archaeon IMC4]